MEQSNIDADFIEKIGKRCAIIILESGDNRDWIIEVADYQETNDQFQDDVLPELIRRLSNSNDSNKDELIQEINKICSNKDNINDFLLGVFFAELDDEKDDETKDKPPPKIIHIPPFTIAESSLDPYSYFEYHTTQLADKLRVHHDLAHLLLNRFNWDAKQIESEWNDTEKRAEILKTLRIGPEINYGPRAEEPFAIKSLGIGFCDICYKDCNEMLELYCGHKLCAECLILEIKEHLKSGAAPVCRATIQGKENCEAELIDKSCLERVLDERHYQLYLDAFLNNMIRLNHKVKVCPYPDCGWIITPANRCPCNVGKCHHCETCICMSSDHEVHAPLRHCAMIEDFFVNYYEEMKLLEEDQKIWIAREEKLKYHRREHKEQVIQYFEQQIAELKSKNAADERKEKEKIQEFDKEIESVSTRINELTRKKKELMDQGKSTHEVSYQIDDLHEELDHKNNIKFLLEKEMESNSKEREQSVSIAEKEYNLFMLALNDDPSKFVYHLNNFIYSQKANSDKKVEGDQDIENFINVKRCPKCCIPLERRDYCNHMICPVCKCEFCWVCLGLWDEKHSSHFYNCPSQEEMLKKCEVKKSHYGIDLSDPNDTNFYPQPISMEKRIKFSKYKVLLEIYQEEKEKYNELKLWLTDDKNNADLEDGLQNIDFSRLCMKKVIEKIFNSELASLESELMAVRFVNNLLFAQSVLMWSYPALFYMKSELYYRQKFKFDVSQLRSLLDEVMKQLKNPIFIRCSDLLEIKKNLERRINMVLHDAELF